MRKHSASLDYIKRTAAMIERDYPGSAADMVPKLRAIYREKMSDLPKR